MKDISVFIFDDTTEYTQALTHYLMNRKKKEALPIAITKGKDEEILYDKRNQFTLGLIGEEVLNNISLGKIQGIQNLIILTEDISKKEEEGYFYRYQNTRILIKIIESFSKPINAELPSRTDCRISVLYSPIYHELSEVFSLSLCRGLSQKGRTLFLDLAQNSILPPIREFGHEDLIDILYMLESEEIKNPGDFIYEYEGINIFPICCTPDGLSYITDTTWKKLVDMLSDIGYENLVIFVGGLITGFANMCRMAYRIILITKQGDFYEISSRFCRDYMDRLGVGDRCQNVYLPMSAANLSKGAYSIEHLIQGNIFEFIKKEGLLE